MKTHLYKSVTHFSQTSYKNVESESEFSWRSGANAPQIPTYDLLVSQFRGNVTFKASEWLMVAHARTPAVRPQDVWNRNAAARGAWQEPGIFSACVCLVHAGGWKKVYGGK